MGEPDRNEAVTPRVESYTKQDTTLSELEALVEYKKLVLIEDDCERRMDQAKGTLDICTKRYIEAREKRLKSEHGLRRALTSRR